MSCSISLICCGVSKFTTFLTSAIALSNAIAGFTNPYSDVPSATTSIICERYADRLDRFACRLVSNAVSDACLFRRISIACPRRFCSAAKFLVSTPAACNDVDISLSAALFCSYPDFAIVASFFALRKLLFSSLLGFSVFLISLARRFTSASAAFHSCLAAIVLWRNSLKALTLSEAVFSCFMLRPRVSNCCLLDANAPLNVPPSSAPMITETAVWTPISFPIYFFLNGNRCAMPFIEFFFGHFQYLG